MSFVFLKNHTTITRYFDTLRQILTEANRESEDLPTDNFFLRVFFSKNIIEPLYTHLCLSRLNRSWSVFCVNRTLWDENPLASQIKIFFFLWFSCASAFSCSDVVVSYNSRQSSQSRKTPPWDCYIFECLSPLFFGLFVCFFKWFFRTGESEMAVFFCFIFSLASLDFLAAVTILRDCLQSTVICLDEFSDFFK